MSLSNNPPLSYADAGVDIDAGNALVSAIKPLIAATKRPGTDGSIGGFGGVFDIAATGYTDPLLVAANDGVGTKLKLPSTPVHTTRSASIWSPCASTISSFKARSLCSSSTIFATGKLDVARDSR